MRRTPDQFRAWLLAHPNDRWVARDATKCPLAAECRENTFSTDVITVVDCTQYFADGEYHRDVHAAWERFFIAVVDEEYFSVGQREALGALNQALKLVEQGK